MTTQIDIIIVNWNAGNQLHDCVESVIRHGHSLVSKIIVVDNGSTDGSDRSVEGLQNVTLIRAGQNLGFGKACNLGATQADSDFLLFLNPDACLFPNALPDVLRFMLTPENSKVGICGVQLIDEYKHVSRSCSRFPSVTGLVSHALGLDRLFPGLGHFMTEWDHATTRQVDQIMGAFFLVRRGLFNDLGGFDERFFVYFEEVDFSRRAKMQGWTSVYFAGAKVFHAGGGTSQQVKARRLFYSLRSRILYSFKHFNLFTASFVLLVTLLVEPFSRSILAALKGSLSFLQETWLAYALLFRWLPALFTKTKAE
jgi:hypothetical protein